MTRKEAERLVDKMRTLDHRGEYLKADKIYNQIISAITFEPNQPEGEGEYLLTVKVNVKCDTTNSNHAIIPRFAFNNNFTNYFYCKHITGHWQKIDK